jgi:hypothetical protein
MPIDPSTVEQYKRTLGRYLPTKAVDPTFDFIQQHNIHLHITRERHSKLGDYRWPQLRHPFHEISVNGNLNPYTFLWVLLHEMAHLNTHQRYGNRVQPHGHEWQEEYRQLIMAYIANFPTDAATLMRTYCRQIPLSHSIGTKIETILHHYDPDYNPASDLSLNQLSPGTVFRPVAKPSLLFKAIEKRRTRWICLNLDDKKQYLVSGTAQVEIINNI